MSQRKSSDQLAVCCTDTAAIVRNECSKSAYNARTPRNWLHKWNEYEMKRITAWCDSNRELNLPNINMFARNSNGDMRQPPAREFLVFIIWRSAPNVKKKKKKNPNNGLSITSQLMANPDIRVQSRWLANQTKSKINIFSGNLIYYFGFISQYCSMHWIDIDSQHKTKTAIKRFHAYEWM